MSAYLLFNYVCQNQWWIQDSTLRGWGWGRDFANGDRGVDYRESAKFGRGV